MKRLFFVIPIVLCLTFPACKKASGPADGKSVQPNNNLDSAITMTATINGNKWQSDSAYGYYVSNSGNDSGMVNLLITATQKGTGTPTTITFNINNYVINYTGSTTYRIDPPYNTAAYYVGNFRNYSDSGVIVITADTAIHALTGTFSFKADTFAVTSGAFNVALP